VKLTEAQREEIKELYTTTKTSYQKVADMFEVSKRLVYFIVNPDKAEQARAGYKIRRQDGRYYNKELHKLAMRKHRKHKGEVHTWAVLNAYAKSRGWENYKSGTCETCGKYLKCLRDHIRRQHQNK